MGGARVEQPAIELERGRRNELAEAIVRCRDTIEKVWLARITKSVNRPDVSPTELRNSMADYLHRLVDGLMTESSASAGGTASWESVAREHAEARVHLGFDIDQLVQDFIVLRQVLMEVLDEERVLYDVRQASKIADLIEGAIAAAVKSYVQSRDYDQRRIHAEHVGFVTHELRTPLSTAILGVAQLRRSAGPMTPHQERMFEVIERNHHRLGELIEGVLLMEREAHDPKPRPRLLTIGELLAEPLASARLAAEAKGIGLQAKADGASVVHVDPVMAKSAIDNVIQNAVKYTDDGDVEVALEEHARDVVVHVRDNCPGISADELRSIFEPFRRGSSRKPGTGLGLAIARRALEAQGGTVDAESGAGHGCHFWITLPKAPAH